MATQREQSGRRDAAGVRCLHVLFCESCQIEPDGTTTLVSLFTRLTTRRLPPSRPLCYACFLECAASQGEGPVQGVAITLRILSPLGVTLHTSTRQAPFVPHARGRGRCGLTIPISGLSFDAYGDYAFELYVGEERVHTEVLTFRSEG